MPLLHPKGANVRVRLVAEKGFGEFTGKTELSVQLLSVTVDGNPVPVNTISVTEGSGSHGSRTVKRAAAVGAGAGAAAGAGSTGVYEGDNGRIPSQTAFVHPRRKP